MKRMDSPTYPRRVSVMLDVHVARVSLESESRWRNSLSNTPLGIKLILSRPTIPIRELYLTSPSLRTGKDNLFELELTASWSWQNKSRLIARAEQPIVPALTRFHPPTRSAGSKKPAKSISPNRGILIEFNRARVGNRNVPLSDKTSLFRVNRLTSNCASPPRYVHTSNCKCATLIVSSPYAATRNPANEMREQERGTGGEVEGKKELSSKGILLTSRTCPAGRG